MKMQRANDLASDIARLQNRYAEVDNQWHNLMAEDRAPTAAFLSSAAVAPRAAPSRTCRVMPH